MRYKFTCISVAVVIFTSLFIIRVCYPCHSLIILVLWYYSYRYIVFSFSSDYYAACDYSGQEQIFLFGGFAVPLR